MRYVEVLALLPTLNLINNEPILTSMNSEVFTYNGNFSMKKKSGDEKQNNNYNVASNSCEPLVGLKTCDYIYLTQGKSKVNQDDILLLVVKVKQKHRHLLLVRHIGPASSPNAKTRIVSWSSMMNLMCTAGATSSEAPLPLT